MDGWMDGWMDSKRLYIYIYIYTIFYNHISYGDVISWLQYNIYVDVIFSSSFTHTMNINTINTWFFCCTQCQGGTRRYDATPSGDAVHLLRLSGSSVCAVPMACHRLGRRKRKETERVSQGPVIHQDQDHDYGTCAVLCSVCWEDANGFGFLIFLVLFI